MRFSASFISLALALGTASAADCYNYGGCGSFEPKMRLYEAREVLCGSYWFQTVRFSYGYIVVGISGNGFDSQKRCYDSFADIIESCHGTRDGGVPYNWNGARLDVDICACGNVAGEVDFKVESKGNETLSIVAKDV
ncbi:hypothetical protein AURDEDRAFT_125554 [Auricularia subglabra TFB-10046 SS5]|nr:hypothetical protein AURDEDRAFT_125554 [Auricularia subglabra TFB-10046 SS5]